MKWEFFDSEWLRMTAKFGVAGAWAAIFHIFTPFLVWAPFFLISTQSVLAPAWSFLQTLVIILKLLISSRSGSCDLRSLLADPSGFALDGTIVALSSPVKDSLAFSFKEEPLALEIIFKHLLVNHVILDLFGGKGLVVYSNIDDLTLESSSVVPRSDIKAFQSNWDSSGVFEGLGTLSIDVESCTLGLSGISHS